MVIIDNEKSKLISQINNMDIPSSHEKIYGIFCKLIDDGITINQIEELCPKLTGYKIIDILLEFSEKDKNLPHENNNSKVFNEIENYYKRFRIDSNRCLVIADTHIGRLDNDENGNTYIQNGQLKNELGLYNAYVYAYKHGIKDIIHLGDLVEGYSDTTVRKINKDLQLEYLYKLYSVTKDFNTFLLYGNHDFNLIYYDGVDEKFYKKCNSMILTGVNYSYLNFCDYLIKLSHYCKTSDYIDNVDFPFNFELAGHSHVFSVDENQRLVKAPTLSLLNPNQSEIGFLELINEENEFLFKFSDYNSNFCKEKTLTKIINVNN